MTDETSAAPAADASVQTEAASTAQPAAGDSWDSGLDALYDKITAAPEAEEPEAAPSAEEEPVSAAQEPEATPQEPAPQAITGPVSWTAEMRSRLAALPPEFTDLRDYMVGRESEAHGKISRMGQEISQLKPVGELAKSYKGTFERNGHTFESGFPILMQAQELLEQDPVKGIAAIAETFGLDLAKVFGGQQAAPQGAQPQQPVSPEIHRLQQELSGLKATLNDQQRRMTAAQEAEANRLIAAATQEIEAWANGKDHYEDVKPTMAKLFDSGAADTLDEAYEMAIAGNKDIKAKIEEANKARAAAQKAADDAARLKKQEAEVAAAKKAAKVNTGSRPAKVAPTGKWNDDAYLSQVYDSVAGS
jgi:hypothetical protein